MTQKQKVGKIIPRIVGELKRWLDPYKVILFGSYAHGKPNRNSDIDFLVVTGRPVDQKKAYRLRHSLLKSTAIPIQIIMMPVMEFMETRDVIGGIAYPASRYGKTIYEKS